MTPLLTPNQIVSALATVPEWTRNDATISRTFTRKDFRDAIAFVNAVADSAETANHHPDITIQWNKVTLALSTHSAGGLTELDFSLAKALDGLP